MDKFLAIIRDIILIALHTIIFVLSIGMGIIIYIRGCVNQIGVKK